MSKLTVGDVREILESHEIYSHGGDSEKEYEDFGYTSPCGEDFSFTLYYEDNAEALSEALTTYAEGFDPEEHAVNWYNHQNDTSGVPESLKDLLEDAEEIQSTLLQAAREVAFAVEHGFPPSSDNQDRLLSLVVEMLLKEESSCFEVIRDAYDQVKVNSHNGKDTLQIRYEGKIYDITISSGEEVL